MKEQLLAWIRQEAARRQEMPAYTDHEWSYNQGAISSLEDVQDWITVNA